MPATNRGRRPAADEVVPQERLFTDLELAKKYRVCRATIWNWHKRGIIRRVKVGGAARFYEPQTE